MIDQKTLKLTIAKNIAAYRKANNMTQAELAAALNYSDKSISKWERAEGVPDVYVLTLIAELFGITLNDLVAEHEDGEEIVIETTERRGIFSYLHNRIFVTILSAGLVWLVASVIFLILKLFLPNIPDPGYVYIYALPLTFIVLIVFTGLWSSHSTQFLFVTGLIWTLALSVVINVPNKDINFLFVIAAVLQILTLIWYIMKIWNRRLTRSSDKKSDK